jgi:hypothetical protein
MGVELMTVFHEENDLLDTLEYNLYTACEEGFEMMGIVALLSHLFCLQSELQLGRWDCLLIRRLK